MIAATNLKLTRSGFKALAQRTGFAKPVSQQLLDSRGRGGHGRMLMQYSDTRILYLMMYDVLMWYFLNLQTLHIIIFNECRKPQGLAVILYNI